MTYREQIEWSDIWVEAADQNQLPRALLIGDSITRSYFPFAKEALKGKYDCARLATSKCVCDPYFEAELDLLLKQYDFSVIHFNNGLHGWEYDEDTYSKGLSHILDFITKKCPKSQLILATTTPVWLSTQQKTLDPKTERVRERNRMAETLKTKFGLTTNNLFDAVINRHELFSDDGVHFNKEGQKVLGKLVANSILEIEIK